MRKIGRLTLLSARGSRHIPAAGPVDPRHPAPRAVGHLELPCVASGRQRRRRRQGRPPPPPRPHPKKRAPHHDHALLVTKNWSCDNQRLCQSGLMGATRILTPGSLDPGALPHTRRHPAYLDIACRKTRRFESCCHRFQKSRNLYKINIYLKIINNL